MFKKLLVFRSPDDAGAGGENKENGQIDPKIQAQIDEAVKTASAERDKFWSSKFDQKNTELQKLKADADKAIKDKMTAEERSALERKEKEEAISRKEVELRETEARLTRLRLASEAKLDTRLTQYISGSTEEEIKQSMSDLQAVIADAVAQEVKSKLAQSGKPTNGQQNSNAKNPWSKDSFNLTEQSRITIENPALAEQLRSAAGA